MLQSWMGCLSLVGCRAQHVTGKGEQQGRGLGQHSRVQVVLHYQLWHCVRKRESFVV